MLQDFKKFILRGNVLELAVAVVIGAAFGKIVSSFVADILMPPLGLLLGSVDFSNLFINLSHSSYVTLAEAKKAGAPTLNYGVFINQVIDFLIIAFSVFLVIRLANRFSTAQAPAPASTRPCAYCLMEVPLKAVKCGHCTSVCELS
jgi:large conductance mechanosensitive channel